MVINNNVVASSPKQLVIEYTKQFEAMYDRKPHLSMVDRGQIKNIVKKFPSSYDLKRAITAYLSLKAPFLMYQQHPLRLFLQNLGPIMSTIGNEDKQSSVSFVKDDGAVEIS